MLTLLVVDDDPDQVELVIYCLQNKGYIIYTAYSIVRAKEILATKHIDVLISDFSLPDGTGEMLVSPKKAEVNILVTGNFIDFRRAKDMGFDSAFLKPWKPRELIAAINSCIRNKGLQPMPVSSQMHVAQVG
jgi:two-component system, OmpR family, response regulator